MKTNRALEERRVREGMRWDEWEKQGMDVREKSFGSEGIPAEG